MNEEKASEVPIHKKGDKLASRNYQPVSLLTICGNVFERLLYNNLFEFFVKNNLISPYQSGLSKVTYVFICSYLLIYCT